MAKKNLWIMAGESSGELYASRLYGSLKAKDPDLVIKGMGGKEMKRAGVEILVDSTELGVMGFVEVLKMYPTFKRVFNQLLKQALEERPDAVLMIDYPGFNLRLAKKLHAAGIKVIWYVCPQVWAWHKKRIPIFAENVDKMLVLFPFETEIWQGTGLDAEFVGHPLLEMLKDVPRPERDPKLLLLLPGSRRGEISRLLEDMIRTADALTENDPELRFVLPTPRESIQKMVQEMVEDLKPKAKITVVADEAPEWMAKATAGLAASGTVTLQAAIMGLPLVSVYRLSWLTYRMARAFVKLPHCTLINIITRREVYPEFLQHEVKLSNLLPAMESIMPGGTRRKDIEQTLLEVKELLGGERKSFEISAEAIYKVIQ